MVLSPGGYHVMLVGLKRPLRAETQSPSRSDLRACSTDYGDGEGRRRSVPPAWTMATVPWAACRARWATRHDGNSKPLATPAAPDLVAADHAARHWTWPAPGALPIGSGAHRDAACRMFRDTFNPYRPSIIEWPALSPEALARLTGLPIWDIAVQTEGKARLRMLAYGRSLA